MTANQSVTWLVQFFRKKLKSHLAGASILALSMAAVQVWGEFRRFQVELNKKKRRTFIWVCNMQLVKKSGRYNQSLEKDGDTEVQTGCKRVQWKTVSLEILQSLAVWKEVVLLVIEPRIVNQDVAGMKSRQRAMKETENRAEAQHPWLTSSSSTGIWNWFPSWSVRSWMNDEYHHLFAKWINTTTVLDSRS